MVSVVSDSFGWFAVLALGFYNSFLKIVIVSFLK